ncbi:hypothetical protein Ddye_031661 [Dipteronia dyeriana]|uniref:Leucine-rich repeat protein n=1 Tax=Dipteronia dyeriana TaxID=168575 RepID=A0AAD9WMH6_9ROSI|nr:hypothetical protein Ddye_031661 [Dipteronia dyeriana]
MASRALVYILFVSALTVVSVHCNSEGDALHAWRNSLSDPKGILQSWDPTLINPCTWFHVTCNGKNSVVRVDLGNAGLQGPLIPELGVLRNLQYLELFNNNITGSIPAEIGNLTNLISLDLYLNKLSGNIPASLGNLKSLVFLRLNNNNLTGSIPTGLIQLILYGNLSIMNVANNSLAGTVHPKKQTRYAVTTIIQDPRAPK